MTRVLPWVADHAMGLELQLVELVEQQARALVQHRTTDADRLEREIVLLRSELAATADATALSSKDLVRRLGSLEGREPAYR